MKSKRVQAMVLATAAVAGYGGAAAFSAVAAPALPVITDWGPGDGLTRYVLTATSGTTSPELLAGLGGVDGVVSAQTLSDGRALVATDGLVPQDLAAVSGVSAVELSPQVPVAATVTDPFFPSYGWHLENTGTNAYGQSPVVADADVDAAEGWDTGTGDGMIVAVVDSGFDSDHPDLAGSLWVNPDESCGSADTDGNGKAGDCHGWNWYTNSADIDNGSYGSHGASVSGTVGARAGNGEGLAGVAPDVTIMPLVIGGGSTVDVLAGAEAIRYAVDHGADVINASWGGYISGYALDALRSAVAYAAAHDVLVVAAAGNDSGNRDTNLVYPASLPDWNLVTVGSSTAGDTVSSFSGYGAASVDLFAPGSRVVVTSNTGGYALADGTSFSSPIVAAAVALYREAMPTATAAEIKRALLADVDPKPAFTGKSVTGGRLSLARLSAVAEEKATYAFASMTAPAGVVTPAIGVTGPTTAGDYEVVLGLGMEYGGSIWALSDKPVTLDGVTVTTDDAGDAVFPLGTLAGLDGVGLSPSMELGDGRYVLTVQTLRDGSPVGRMYAAPLLVGTAVPVPGTPGGSTPGSAPGGSAPDGSTPGGSTPGATTPPGTDTTPTSPGGGTAPGDPGTGDSGASTPGGSGGGSGGGTAPGTTPGTAPGTTPGASPDSGSDGSDPGTGTPSAPLAPTAPGGTSPGSGPTPDTSNPDTSTPGGSTPGGSTPGGPVPGTTTYPSVGEFRITSLSPNVVDVAGGTIVTITGEALPAGPSVRIGDTAAATVIRATTTEVTFRVPARVAGVYDVSVFAPDGRSTVLSDALTYAATVGTAPDGSGSTPGGSTPGGTSPGDSAPGGSTPGGATPDDGASDSGSTPDTSPVVQSGPAGERLVSSAKFGRLGSIWSTDCSSSCTGVAI
ncbi:subtilisin family serine protease [Blastococcus colisei]|uniref:Subtilisin family serine protease n=1 Tax=Blastococcus colisei TaxID=1564162 RepID=A0A543PAE8_9ACTN|nr:S8 family serine peptidase [Blastococcus colisei]TQN41056.1 subtilisin family serine protease [Blastococcus colisei]